MIFGATVLDLGVFMVASAVCIAGAIGVVVARNPIHSALCLVATLFGIAVHFIALGAEFLAAVQVMVYAGAVVVLFLFVIMLLGVDKEENAWGREPIKWQRIAGLAFGALIFAQIVALGGRSWASDAQLQRCLPATQDQVNIEAEPVDASGELLPPEQLCYMPDTAAQLPLAAAPVATDEPINLNDVFEGLTEAEADALNQSTDGADLLDIAIAVDGPDATVPSTGPELELMLFIAKNNGNEIAQQLPPADGTINPRWTGNVSSFGNISQVAQDVFLNQLLAFEAVSVLLIVAVVAAVVMAKRPPRDEQMIDLADTTQPVDDPEEVST